MAYGSHISGMLCTRNKNCLCQPWFLSYRDEMRKSYRRPSIDASWKMLLYLVKWFQRRRFLEIDQPETRLVYDSMGVMFVNRSVQNEHIYREPSIDASYQVSVHMVKMFQMKRFLEINQSEIRIAYGVNVY